MTQDGDRAAVRSLLTDYSVEITPREGLALPSFGDILPPRSRVYVTYLPRSQFSDTVAAASRAVEGGMRPVPHLAARSIPDAATLDQMATELADVGVTDALVIAGSVDSPAGEFSESTQVLRAGALQRHGITSIGVAGHPEGNPDIGPGELAAALAAKNELAVETNFDLYLVTQFSFAAEPIIAWEKQIRAAGNRLPIIVGLPGLTSPAKLLKFGIACGIGASLKVLRKQAGGVVKLATSPVYHPDQTLLGLARGVAADPESLIHGVHFFPFGALVATAAWADELTAGHFAVHGAKLKVDS